MGVGINAPNGPFCLARKIDQHSAIIHTPEEMSAVIGVQIFDRPAFAARTINVRLIAPQIAIFALRAVADQDIHHFDKRRFGLGQIIIIGGKSVK